MTAKMFVVLRCKRRRCVSLERSRSARSPWWVEDGGLHLAEEEIIDEKGDFFGKCRACAVVRIGGYQVQARDANGQTWMRTQTARLAGDRGEISYALERRGRRQRL